jgi:WD40 repeat protein
MAWGMQDGQSVLAIADTDAVVIWNPVGGQQSKWPFTRGIERLAWGKGDSSDVLAVASAQDVWWLHPGDPIKRVGTQELDDNRAAVAVTVPRSVAEKMPLTSRSEAHSGSVRAMAWGWLDGHEVLAIADDSAVHIWTPRDNEIVVSHTATGVEFLAWGKAGKSPLLAIACNNGAVRIWDPQREKELAVYEWHPEFPQAVAWGQLRDREVLATSGKDGLIRIVDPVDGQEVVAQAGLGFRLAWGYVRDKPILAFADLSGALWLWEDPLAGGKPTELVGGTGGSMPAIEHMAWGQVGDHAVLAYITSDRSVMLWDPAVGANPETILQAVASHARWMKPIAWGQFDSHPALAYCSVSGNLCVTELQLHQQIHHLPSYQSGFEAGEESRDLLGREKEARALAELICTKSARPPLAIGLFGDWGEGKSHFIHQISDQVGTFKGDWVHRAVRQVHFNAWHYAETDLWASLVAELFEQLSQQESDPGQAQRQQSRLTAELVKRRKLQERLVAARSRYDKLHEELESSRRDVPQDLEIRLKESFGDQTAQIAKTSIGTANAAVQAAQVAISVARQVIRALFNWWWLVLLAVGFLTAALVLVRLALQSSSFASLLASVTAFTLGIVAAAKPVREAWKASTEFRRTAASAAAKLRHWNSERLSALQTAHDVAAAEVQALEADLRDLTAAGQLAGLVSHLSQEGSYRSRLGVMTRIREDFQAMARLLASATDEAAHDLDEVDSAGDRLPKIDRIVLYIDDLDRCPPKRVIAVLEAVHLLLAVPLFVVVVAVDPRWLLRSLTVHYHELLAPLVGLDVGAAAGTEGDGHAIPASSPVTLERDVDVLWSSTPIHYLEKIFQVPLTLAPLTPTGYSEMVMRLTNTPAEAQPHVASPAHPAPSGNARVAADSRTEDPPTPLEDVVRAELPAASPASNEARQDEANLPTPTIVEGADPLAFSDDERRLLSMLGPGLIATPRSIKRLINSYGLLRAFRWEERQQDLGPYTDPKTGQEWYPYRAAMVLLATLIGFPGESPALFRTLYTAPAQGTPKDWSEFVSQLQPRQSNNVWANACGDGWTTSEVYRWTALAAALQQLSEAVRDKASGLPPLELPQALKAWAEWVVPVGRLSFATGHVVSELEHHPTVNQVLSMTLKHQRTAHRAT